MAEIVYKFASRRSSVLCTHGVVASNQPLASRIGVQILKKGGNAADAAVAVAAALNVTQPCSTGIGGDCFCLYYDANSRTVKGLNGSGRAPAALTLDLLRNQGIGPKDQLPPLSAHSVTVPGAAAGWVDTVDVFGSKKLSMRDVLQPAIELAEEGFPVHHLTAHLWNANSHTLTRPENRHGSEMLLDGRPPREGDVMRLPNLAKTFKLLAEHGKAGFYQGPVAKAIVNVIHEHGGVMTLEDLAAHRSTFDEPIKTCYRGINVWEIPPNGQGITALIALNILEGFNLKELGHNSPEYLHLVAEALKLSFADTLWYNADPEKVHVPIKHMLSKEYAAERRKLIMRNRVMPECHHGTPYTSSDTEYLTVVDCHGNACSFIDSNYMNFGTGLVPQGCGFTLQNRGCNFSLDPDHPNALSPGKRPYHTIIPGMATYADSGELYTSFGVMGGFMQPQGHVQVLANMIDFGMDPQQALDMPRLHVNAGLEGLVSLEEGIPQSTIDRLRALGHKLEGPISGYQRTLFGRGQIIMRKRGHSCGGEEVAVLWAGSEGRGDGMAVGY
ncbi:glutathione hydrolase-like YwrD proenzyme isoform X1 [Nematostella vectensis]|uniref:glutathione hydrolase-like YwrD proenzyme isoform X1 n=1 Tax=Nematostella vectensis TaxID=45351 RepID=UPI00207725B8|nr:glutathione hydrolase-like YwrD proenzyme isoform X1 [Nematostella vectensis]